MSYPPTKPDATFFDSDSDRISSSRAELKTAVDAINTIIDTIDTTGIATNQTLVWNGTKFVAGTTGEGRSSFGDRNNLGTITTGGTYTYNITSKYTYLGFNLSSGVADVTINITDQELDTEYYVILHKFSTDNSSDIRVDIIDTADSATNTYTYYNNTAPGAIATLFKLRKYASNETGRYLYDFEADGVQSSV